MNRKTMLNSWLAVWFAVLLFLLLPVGASSTESFANDPGQIRYTTANQPTTNTLDITVGVFLAEHYEFLDSDIRDEIVVNITTSLTRPQPTVYTLALEISFFSLDKVLNLPAGSFYTYGFWGYPPVGMLNIYLPANVTYSFIRLEGHFSGSSFFWRNTAEIQFLNLTSPIVNASSYRLFFIPPTSSKVVKVYSRFYPNLQYEDTLVGEQRRIIVSETHPNSPIVILYEPQVWETYGIIGMFTTIFMVYLIPYASNTRKFKTNAKWFRSNKIFRQLSLPKLIALLKRLYREVLNVNSMKLLTVYFLCAFLMISLSFTAGPDPRLKVYVLASTPENAARIDEFAQRYVGAVAITVFDEMNEFKLLTDLGVFRVALIGDFYPPTDYMLKTFIYPALDSIPRIIIIERYAFGPLSAEIQRRYSDKTTVVKDTIDLGPILVSMSKRTNVLGIDVTPATYMEIAALTGALSFALIFFGLAFLICKLMEIGRKPAFGGLIEAVSYVLFFFIFTQLVYIVSSVLLAMPVGLHTSSPKVTAVGSIGFGGGSKPRMFAGLAGFLYGSLVGLRGGPKLNKGGFGLFLLAVFFVLIDPLTSGIIFYELVLFVTIGPTLESALIMDSYLRDILGSIGTFFGGWVTPTYGISIGVILFFAGTIPICLFPKLKKSTATLMLLICAFIASSGVIRVADMMPWKAIASFIPGLMAGLILVALFGSINLLEELLRSRL